MEKSRPKYPKCHLDNKAINFINTLLKILYKLFSRLDKVTSIPGM